MLNNISVVLCQTSHPGNIGQVARAMKNMGLSQLVLVAPKAFPHPKAEELASGAVDVLANAQVVATLRDALANHHWVYGTSARTRAFPWPLLTPKQAVAQIIPQSTSQKVALVFGPERTGLQNEDLQLCDYHIAIPANPDYSSLNLAQAVQVLSYELYQAAQEGVEQAASAKAPFQKTQALLSEIEQMAIRSQFMDAEHPQKFMPYMQRIVSKAQLDNDEVNLLWGFLKSLESPKT